jgi:hypothetical protein
VTLFAAFLRPIGNEDKAWSNSLRLSKEFPVKRHDHVLEAMREVREELGSDALPNFRDSTYTDANGRQRPMIEFSEDVLMPVVGRVGGKRASVGLRGSRRALLRLLGRSGLTQGLLDMPTAPILGRRLAARLPRRERHHSLGNAR